MANCLHSDREVVKNFLFLHDHIFGFAVPALTNGNIRFSKMSNTDSDIFYLDFRENILLNDLTTVIFQIPSSIRARRDKVVKIRFFAVDSLDSISFLRSPELTFETPYLENLVAAYIPSSRQNTSFREAFSIPSTILSIRFQVISSNDPISFEGNVNAYLVLEII
jgi:hypothetical protein